MMPEREPILQFGSIADLAVDGTGRFIVHDQLAGEARIFAEDGTFVRTLARRRAGPGEISRWVSTVLTDAYGRIYLPDPVQRRITVFDSSGAALPALAIPSQPAGQSWFIEEDGSFLFRA